MSSGNPWNRRAALYTAVFGCAVLIYAGLAYIIGWDQWSPAKATLDEAIIRNIDRDLALLITYSYEHKGELIQKNAVFKKFDGSRIEPAKYMREELLARKELHIFISSDDNVSPRFRRPPPTAVLKALTTAFFVFFLAIILFVAPGLAQGLAAFSARRPKRTKSVLAGNDKPEPKNMVIHLVASPFLAERGQCLARANVLLGAGNPRDLRFEVVIRDGDNRESMGTEQGDTITLGDEIFDKHFVLRTNFPDTIDNLMATQLKGMIIRLYKLYQTDHCSIMLNCHCLTIRKAIPIAESENIETLKGSARDITHCLFGFLGIPQLVQSVDIVMPPGGLQTKALQEEKSERAAGLSNPQLNELLAAELPSHYSNLDIIGRGGMGAVFQATDKRNDTTVAIKILEPRLAQREAVIRRFYRETVATANLRHENIPKIMDVKRGRLPYYVMEYIEGAPLDRILRKQKRLTTRETLDIALQVSKALAIAHDNNIVHRDIKPSNIIVSNDGIVKVVDFGIAHFDEDSDLTSSGQSLGTPQYMSPEQMEGKDVGPETDIYSLGVVLFEGLAGELPFPARAPFARVFKEPPKLSDSAPDTPAQLTSLVMRCLQKRPEDRFQDGNTLIEAINECLNILDVSPSHLSPNSEHGDQTIDCRAAPAPIFVSDENLKKQLRETLPSRYRDINPIGRGGMGAVFIAVDNNNDNLVAIKVLDPRFITCDEIVRRFYRETIAISNLRHENIPKIMDVKRGDLPYFVMEYVPGESLDKIMNKKKKLSEEETISLAAQIAQALAAAHKANIIHRDVKPGNIIVTDKGTAKVLDFGLAHLDEGTALTKTGQPLGTPRYMSPEQIQGMQTEYSSDIYSLGYTMYEMATGTQPFSPVTPLERVYKEPRPIKESDGISETFAATIMRCLNKNPQERFQNGDELFNALSGLTNNTNSNN